MPERRTARDYLYIATHNFRRLRKLDRRLPDAYERPTEARAVDGTTAIAAALGLEEAELFGLLRCFRGLDANGDARVSPHELLTFLDLDPTPLLKRIFGVFDGDGDGSVDFREFVFGCYQFCSLSPHGLLLLYFRCFATKGGDGTYALAPSGRAALLDFLYPGSGFEEERRKTKRELEHCGSLASWTAWIESHSLHGLRLAEIQGRLVARCGGETLWRAVAARRRDYFGDRDWLAMETYVSSAHGLPSGAPAAAPAAVAPAPAPTARKRERRAVPEPAAAAPRRRRRVSSSATKRVAPLPRRKARVAPE